MRQNSSSLPLLLSLYGGLSLSPFFFYVVDHPPIGIVKLALILLDIDECDVMRFVGVSQSLADYVKGIPIL